MMQFFLAVGVLLTASYLLFIPVLRGKQQTTAPKRDKLRLVMYQQRRQELEQELAQGNLDQAAYTQLAQELDLQLLEDSSHPETSSVQATPSRWPVLIILLLLPFLALGLYGYLGRPDTLIAPPPETADIKLIEENIQGLAQRLQQTPDDLQGWLLLARSYQVTHHATQAQAAYEKAIALQPNDLDIKALYAEAVAENQNNRLQGRPAEIIAEILKADANHPTGLWLAGLAAAEQGDKKIALDHWEKLKALTPADSEDARQLDSYIAMLSGQPSADAAASKLSITVKVTLAASLAAKAQPNDTLFVFAKSTSGSPMPLAIVRKQVKDLPLTVTLDDSMAMDPRMKLSVFPQIVLGARVSKSGQAVPASGDIQGFSATITPIDGRTYDVEINQLLP